MPPRRQALSYITPGYFLARITDISDAPAYQFVESWMSDDSGTMSDKAGGRYGDADNPGFAVNGAAFAVDDLVLCRLADGAAGAVSELIPLPASLLTVKEVDGAPSYAGVTTLEFDQADGFSLSQPGAGIAKVNFSGGGATSLSWKQTVRVATTTAGTLSTSFASGQTVDGGTLATGNRILIKDQSSASDNGIYTVNASGAPTRASDSNTGALLLGATVTVQEGTDNGDTEWLCTADAPITVGTTALPWILLGPLAGTGTDNDLVRWDGTQKIQDSPATLDDTGLLTTNQVYATGGSIPGGPTTSGVISDCGFYSTSGWLIISTGNINCGGTIDGAQFASSGTPGISGTRTVKDSSGTNQTVTLTNGLITGWTT